jgi:hypothetical protein
MIVDVMQVVHNNEQSLARITAAEVAEGFANVQDGRRNRPLRQSACTS